MRRRSHNEPVPASPGAIVDWKSLSKADAIREMSRWPLKAGVSIEVRDEKGQVMFIRFAIEIEIGRKN